MEENRRRIWELMNEDFLFEYQFREDSLSYLALRDGEIRDICIPDFRGNRRTDEWICPEDKEGAVYALFESDLSLGQVASYEMRIKKKNGDGYAWRRVLFLTLPDANGGKERLLGRVIGIERQKRQEETIRGCMDTDADTGFLKREAMKRQADRYFAEEGRGKEHALLCLELVDYDSVSGMIGTEMMRAVVRYVGSCLKEAAGCTDLIGRTGLARFTVLMKNTDRESADSFAAEIEEKIQGCYSERERGIVLGCRAALAFAPEDGLSFEGLLQKAELELSVLKLKESEGQRENIASQSDRELFSWGLGILTMARDKKKAALRVLEETAGKLGLDRIVTLRPGAQESLMLEYVFGSGSCPTGDGTEIPVTAEFDPYLYQCGPVAVNDCLRTLGKDSPFCVKTGARSALFCFCIFRHDFIGTLVFIDTEKEREWTGFEKQTLEELAKILWLPLFGLQGEEGTERKMVEALSHAKEAGRAKDAFISNMSHEIRTPLNAIMGMADLIKNHAGEAERVREYAGKLEQSSRYLLQVINDCLDVSKMEAGNAVLDSEDFQLSGLLHSVEKKWFDKAEKKGITMHKENFAGDFILRGDRKRVRIILGSILDNAIKFTPEGGNIWVSVNRIYQKANRVNLRFQIGDDGIGMTEEFLKRIWEPFSQEHLNSDDPFGGSGLGMTVCRDIITLLNGAIRIKSKPGNGTEVIIELPFEVSKETEESRQEEEPLTADVTVDFHGKRILLAEDNSLNAEIARMMLEEDGFSVDCVSNGKRAVERFERKGPYYYDVILMDIRMPVMDGWEAAKAIRGMEKEDGKTIPIVAMTANAFNEDVIKSFASGMNDHVTKPIERIRLIHVLNKLLADRDKVSKPGN